MWNLIINFAEKVIYLLIGIFQISILQIRYYKIINILIYFRAWK